MCVKALSGACLSKISLSLRVIRGDQIFNGFSLERHSSKIFCQVTVANVFKFPVGYKFGIRFGCFYA